MGMLKRLRDLYSRYQNYVLGNQRRCAERGGVSQMVLEVNHGEMYEGEGLPVADSVGPDAFDRKVRARMRDSSLPNSSRMPVDDRPY